MNARTFLAAAVLSVLALGCAKEEKDHSAAPALPVIRKAPSFTYRNYDGKTVTDQDLKGKIYIVEFFFSTCKGPCPVMNSNASVLQAEFASMPDFRIVSFTVDPATDTPERLREFAQRYGAKPDRWYFLRGDQHATGAMSADGFLMGDEEDPMMHSTHFALVDRKGMIRGYYDALDNARIDSLRGAIRALDVEKS